MTYVQMAELEIAPEHLLAFRAAIAEQVEAAVREEPGVLALHAVAERDRPSHVRVFEIYRDVAAYEAHLAAPHFRKYKATVENMVLSLRLVPVQPIVHGDKAP